MSIFFLVGRGEGVGERREEHNSQAQSAVPMSGEMLASADTVTGVVVLSAPTAPGALLHVE
jgi:hypothetical protein